MLLIALALMRLGFWSLGIFQNIHMDVKYTDIDYFVFTDAARYVFDGKSPYTRTTYRYTPLLSWILVPTVWFFEFGIGVFVICDLLTGYYLLRILQHQYPESRTKSLASICLLNPIAAQISTRGSLESLLTVIIMLSIFNVTVKQCPLLSGVFMGLAAHIKLYPVIYVPTIMIYLAGRSWTRLVNSRVIYFAMGFTASFIILTVTMYKLYGIEFLSHSIIYHVIRIDHRHNFSIYNMSLYHESALASGDLKHFLALAFAFIPQLGILAVLIPLLGARQDLVATLFLQTWLFVTFNKVITSQYFVWFLIFLPAFLARLNLAGPCWRRGVVILAVWVCTQALWLFYAYELEFKGKPTFDAGLLFSSCSFFLGNCWALGQFINHFNVRNAVGS